MMLHPPRFLRTAGSLLALLALLAGCRHTPVSGDVDAPLAGAGQLVLVVTDGWDATGGRLQRFERGTDGGWRAVGESSPVAVGRAGSAWGLGLHDAARVGDGPQKREGDGRAPAGAFALGTAFGYGASAETALPYDAMDAGDWCIDVPASPLYNRIVDVADVGTSAIDGSTEPMRRDLHQDGDPRYRLGLVIAHNASAVPGAGSCIFAHLWRTPGEATAGCTAMADASMQALLGWLDPARTPVFVLLPRDAHARLRVGWGLPATP